MCCCAEQPVKNNMLILFTFLLLSYGASNILCSTVPANSSDMLSLLDVKQAIDPGNVLSNWNSSTPFCQWMGVNCSRTHTNRVTVLDLADQSLAGTLSASLGNLTFLRVLDLSTNHLSGQLPDLSPLRRLKVLDLSSNLLQGTIPDTLTNCSNLKELVLHHNLLEGEIPLKVGLLSKLSRLSLGDNNLTGAIPPTLSNTQLEIISLPNNHLIGSIPPEFEQLSNLSVVFLSGNMLTGEFPAILLNMPSLNRLDLGRNRMHGKLPSNLGNSLPNLTVLVLSSNYFEGQIPASLGNASGLNMLALSYNNLTGEIPTSFGMLTELTVLTLENNKLETPDSRSWEFLYALRNCRKLNVLSLHENRLSGTIPNYIGELSPELKMLFLNDNNLSGIVPSSIGNLTSLINLALGGNSFNGTIGDWIGLLKPLQSLYLRENNLNGTIPSSIGNLTQLTKLDLGQNNFTGSIPSSLGYLQRLSELDLSHNGLHGSIPSEVFSIPTLVKCELSYNRLEGPMPSEVGHLTTLTELHLSSNKIVGNIPDSLSQCQELQVIQLDQNFLSGVIPLSLGNLTSLIMLNISHNNLSGSIPKTLNGLKNLTQLDLSYNHLQGEIPFNGVFDNATAVSLVGNSGLCGGSSDLHMPPCAAVSKRKERRYYLILVLIPIFGFMSLLLLIYFVIVEKMSRADSRLPYSHDIFPKVSYTDLAQATDSFSNLVGKGSYGSVYRGKLIPSKLEVAVKVLDLDTHGAEESFLTECEALRGIKHRNLVPIITACSTVDINGSPFKALIYPFMPNGNLETWLHCHTEDGKAQKRLSLTQRISIAVNIADVLEYLHDDNGRAIVHCDLKPSNILLDDDMTARLGDFGIASFYVDHASSSTEDPILPSSRCISSIGVKGTIGYIAPEYGGGSHVSTYGDVYSFGIVLLEMITGKRPTDPMFENGLNLVNFVERSCPDKIFDIVDVSIQGEYATFAQTNTRGENKVPRCLLSLLQLGLSCTCQIPKERMNMREVASKIASIKSLYVGRKTKGT